ncbi:MAG TPA: hypothetical protein VKV04_09690 [Verrucomicrobiae bacterium]|nr:hypothetical protein [Verrucomicrobiae bacterium]
MKVVIRNVKTGLYWSGFGWAVGINSARNFIRGADAISFATIKGLTDVEVLHVFPEPQYNISTGVMSFARNGRRNTLPCAEHSSDPSSTQYFRVANPW